MEKRRKQPIENTIIYAPQNDCGAQLIYSNDAVLNMLGVSGKTLQRYRNEGLIGYSQIKDKYFYSYNDLTKFMASHHVAPIEMP